MHIVKFKIGLVKEPLIVSFCEGLPHRTVRTTRDLTANIEYATSYCDSVDKMDVDSDVKCGVLSYIHRRLSSQYSDKKYFKEARYEADLAVELAVASGLPEALYFAYKHCGRLSYFLNDTAGAVKGYQQALPYCYGIEPEGLFGMISILEDIGSFWETAPDTQELAKAMYLWCLALAPHYMSANVQLHRIYLRELGAWKFRAMLKNIPKDSCESIAKIVSGWSCLGDTNKAREAAQLGIEMADEAKDSKWQSAFQQYVAQQ